MFLLPSIVVGFVFAILLGGRPSRILEVSFRAPWTVFLALAVQLVLFSDTLSLPGRAESVLYVGSYGLLLAFAIANRRLIALAPAMLGMLMNGIAIAANGGAMPVLRDAARSAGIERGDYENVSEQAQNLWFLGDVFALPDSLPLSNAFSVGDLLICFGMAMFIVVISLDGARHRPFGPQQPLRPLRVPAYRRLLGGKLISTIGDWLTLAALVGWQFEETGSTTAVALTLIARIAPPILGGGIATYVVDRLQKGRLLAWVELGRALAILLALLGVHEHALSIVLVALALSGLLAAISQTATPAIMPSLVAPDELASANAGLGLVKNGAMALGAGGAGVALAATQVSLALVVDGLTFLVAAALFSRLPAAVPGSDQERSQPWWSGLRYVWLMPRILLLVLSFSAATFATGLTNATLPRFLAEGGLGGSAYGFGIAALASGLALGEVTVGFSRVGAGAGRWIGAGLLLTGGLLALLALGHHGPSILLFLGLVGFVDGSTDNLYDLAIQRGTNPRYYGAAFGLSSALTATTMVTAFALAPVLGRIVDAATVIALSGAVFAIGGVIALLAMARPHPGAERGLASAQA
jgi:hypothetical protein